MANSPAEEFYIAKPDLTRGEGIILFNTQQQLNQIVHDTENIIVQKYMPNPLIID